MPSAAYSIGYRVTIGELPEPAPGSRILSNPEYLEGVADASAVAEAS